MSTTIERDKAQPLEKRVLQILFSGELLPGSKITERDLARDLGMSRVPVREVISRLIARGILVRGDKNRSVRTRNYSADDIFQLYELREALEVASGRSACRNATQAELLKMEMICDQMEAEIGHYGSAAWANLDRMFHQTMVAASHNLRLVESFELLIEECHYVFYLHPARKVRPNPGEEWIQKHMSEVIANHRTIVECIRKGDPDVVQDQIRFQMKRAATSATRSIVSEAFLREGNGIQH